MVALSYTKSSIGINNGRCSDEMVESQKMLSKYEKGGCENPVNMLLPLFLPSEDDVKY